MHKDKIVDYTDKDVAAFLGYEESIPDQLYGVTNKILSQATESLKRYNHDPCPYDDEVKSLYVTAGYWLDLEFGMYIRDSHLCTLENVLENMKGGKSPGYPWTLKHPFKRDYWGSDDSSFYETYWELLATTNHVRSLCSVSVKEEIRPIEKVKAGAVRTIISMDVNHVIAHNMLTLDQNTKLLNSCHNHSSYIGLNPYSGGWHKLNDTMECYHGPSTMELDGKQFDGRYTYHCFEQIRDFRYRCLSLEYQCERNKIRLHNLYYELAHAPLVNLDGSVYSRNVGNPSGQACTTPDNTFKNFMDCVVLWLLAVPDDLKNYQAFNHCTRKCIVGDDINISVHPHVQKFFNPKVVSELQSRIGMQYHFGSLVFRHNYECEFLSHGFTLKYVADIDAHMYFHLTNCQKSRTSALIYNDKQTPENTITRVCALRTENFMCISCREWFNKLISFLRRRYPIVDMQAAWKSYMTDAELWEAYTGLKVVRARLSQ